MEKQMRADRDKRAAILTAEGMRQSAVLSAEGQKQSAILTAEGDKQSRILRAQAEREARILKAQGEAQAITTVFNAIHAGKPDQGLLAYQYLQMLPSIAQGDANKLWIVPSEIGDALKGLGSAVGQAAGIPQKAEGTWQAPELSNGEVPELDGSLETSGAPAAAVVEADNAVREAIAAAEKAAVGNRGQVPVTPSVNSQQDLPTQEPPAVEPPQR
jgi:regulator of protease activity HflC (stomatin/prohibitin superfamily)